MPTNPISKVIPTLNVTGTGKSSTKPDIAYLTIGVVAAGKTANEAQTKNSEMAGKLVELLKSTIAEKDIQTSQLNIQQVHKQRDYRNQANTEEEDLTPKVIGYRSSNFVNVTAREIDKVGKLIDEITQAGDYLIQGVQFDLNDTDKSKHHLEAIKKAMANARAQAEVAAASEDKTIAGVGKIVVGQEESYSPRAMRGQVMTLAATAGGGGTDVEPGEVLVPATVTIEYLLDNKKK